ncbi:MAG TPA: extracellular solute-binding protein [Acetobacteraceae bacterium]|jgi:ABC-type glycerol-3-phosphate transport system substrate-binding protein|nr:extracellular solute-binding protein [Acetobacteraceae bacterium]
MKKLRPVSRRDALKLAAAGAALPLVHMRTAHAAGSLKVALWDHWVPAANPAMQKLIAEWGAKNKVDVSIDLLQSGTANAKLLLAEAAESLAGTGHDIMTFQAWGVQQYHQHLEPIDDVMGGLIKQYGAVDPTSAYLGKVDGHWMGLPTSVGSQYKPSCARISYFSKAGYDVRQWYPNAPGNAKTATDWTYDTLLKMAPGAKQAGLPFGLGLGLTTDSVDWTGALLRAYGAVLVDEKGNPQLRSDAVQQVLEYLQKLYEFLPADTVTYDDASNNKALISGQSALIFNPPSAWWVARRDAPKVAEDCWTFPSPSGPAGRFNPYLPFFWGIWSFSPNKTAAKELITWLQQRAQVETLCDVSVGYDIPTFASMHDFKIWAEVKPPLGTVYNYPIRPWHDTQSNVSGFPAPPRIAIQLYNNATFNVMAVKLAKGKQKMKDVLDWAENEINGYINM